jgi:hypothetical protein
MYLILQGSARTQDFELIFFSIKLITTNVSINNENRKVSKCNYNTLH